MHGSNFLSPSICIYKVWFEIPACIGWNLLVEQMMVLDGLNDLVHIDVFFLQISLFGNMA